jgi:predicted ArsR family transcriptional regulator
MTITLTNTQLKVNGETVATVHSDTAVKSLVSSLSEHLTRPAATTFILSVLGEASTAQIADILGMDRSNTFRYLSTLASEGKVQIVEDSHKTGGRGRPTHIWKLV